MSKESATLAVIFLCAAGAFAQAGTGVVVGHPSPVHGMLPAGHPLGVPGAVPFGNRIHHHFARTVFLYGGWPYWAPDYQVYEPEPMIAPQAETPVTVWRKQEPVPDAVLLELHGTEWVKVKFATSVSKGSSEQLTNSATKELPAAVIVYRDGHTEELTSYSIMGATIYTKADYWSTGKWTRKIQVADLDIPATLQRNRDRGVRFDLPTGPDEIVLRP